MKKSRFLAMLMAGILLVASFGVMNVSAAGRTNNIITEFGNNAEIAGLTYCDTVGYNSTSSVRYTKTAEQNTADTNLALAANLGLTVGTKYSYSFYFKPVTMTNKLWIRMNGTTNAGGGAIGMTEGVLTATNGPDCTKVTPAGNGWYKVYSPTANGHQIGWTNMPFFLATKGEAVDFYIDNFSILDESGNEMVTNGGFENQSSSIEIVRENNAVTEFGNTAEIVGLTYSDTVGYNSRSSVRYTKTAEANTADINLAMHANLGMVEGAKYSFSFYIKPVAMTSLWIRINGTTNGGAGAVKFNADGKLCTENAASYLTVAPAGNGWYSVKSNSLAEHKIAWNGMSLLLAGKGAAVDFHIDNFSVLDENGNEMVTNGGFEYVAPTVEEGRENNVITELGNTAEISGLTYSDTVGYNSTSSIHYKKSATQNTADTNLALPANLGMVEGATYTFSFNIKPVAMTSLWIRINGSTNGGAGAVILNENGALYTKNAASYLTVTSLGDGWYSVSSNSPAEHDIAWGGMALLLAGGSGAIEFYMDNFSIKDASGNELVVNGGFEYQEPLEVERENHIITEFGNTAEIAGLTYCDNVSYSGVSSVRYTKTAEANTADINLALPANLGMVEGTKYSFSFYIKPVEMTALWIRINGTTNSGAGSIKFNTDGKLCTENAASFMTVTSVGDGWYKVASNTANEHKIAWGGMALFLAGKGGAIDFYMDNFSVKDEAGNELVVNGGFEPPASQVGNFVMTDNGDGTKTVSVAVTNRGEGNGYTAVLILATYDGVIMKKIAHAEETTIQQGTKEILTETIAWNQGESLKAFLWDSISGMTPLTFARELVSAQ